MQTTDLFLQSSICPTLVQYSMSTEDLLDLSVDDLSSESEHNASQTMNEEKHDVFRTVITDAFNINMDLLHEHQQIIRENMEVLIELMRSAHGQSSDIDEILTSYQPSNTNQTGYEFILRKLEQYFDETPIVEENEDGKRRLVSQFDLHQFSENKTVRALRYLIAYLKFRLVEMVKQRHEFVQFLQRLHQVIKDKFPQNAFVIGNKLRCYAGKYQQDTNRDQEILTIVDSMIRDRLDVYPYPTEQEGIDHITLPDQTQFSGGSKGYISVADIALNLGTPSNIFNTTSDA